MYTVRTVCMYILRLREVQCVECDVWWTFGGSRESCKQPARSEQAQKGHRTALVVILPSEDPRKCSVVVELFR